uniref:Uncharacterized protein n=1 Tax=Rhizophora mucronata TaxID=61149 RepID=A0A2P2PFG3_RHIMU
MIIAEQEKEPNISLTIIHSHPKKIKKNKVDFQI